MNILLEIPSRACGALPGYTKFPDEILSLASVLEKYNHTVRIHDSNVDSLDPLDLKDFNPGIIGFSVATGPNIADATAKSTEYKKLIPKAKMVWGFRHPSALPAQTLAEPFIDYVVIGGAEVTLAELAQYLEGGNIELPAIKGLAFKDKQGQVVINEPRDFITDLNQLPDPAWHLIDFKKYWDVSLIVSRGCPYTCTFCDDASFHKGYIGNLSAKNIVSQMEKLHEKYGINHILFSGENFALNRQRLKEFNELMTKNKLKMTWNCRVSGGLKEEDIVLMAKSGCTSVMLEVETGCERMRLDFLKKGTVSEMEETFSLLLKYRIIPTLFIMYGFPTETADEFSMSLELLERLNNPPYLYMKYVPLPATVLFDYCISHNMFKAPEKLGDWVGFYLRFLNDVNLSAVPQQMVDQAIDTYRSTYDIRRLSYMVKYNPRYFWKAVRSPRQFFRDLRNLMRYSRLYKHTKTRDQSPKI